MPNKHSIDHSIHIIKSSLLFIYFYIAFDDCVHRFSILVAKNFSVSPFSIIVLSIMPKLSDKLTNQFYHTRTHNEAENDHWNCGNHIFIDQSTEWNS